MDESSDRKRCRDDNPEEALPSPGTNTTNKKKRRKRKNKGDPQTPEQKVAESNQGNEVIPNDEPVVTPIPIVPEHEPLFSINVEENAITVENPQLCSKIELAVESGKEKGVGLGHNEATDKVAPLERKKNNVLNPQGAEPNEADPQLCSKTEAAIPVVQENNEVAEPPQGNAVNPTVTPKPESALPENLEMNKDAEPVEPQAQHSHPQPQPQPRSEPDPTLSEDPITPIQQSRKNRRNRKGRNKINCSEEKVENQRNPMQCSVNQIQPDSAIPLCPKPAPPLDQAIPADSATKVDPALSVCPKPVETIISQTIPVSSAIPIDTEQKTVKKERKGTLDGAESNLHNTEPPETLVQTAICPNAVAPIGPAIPTDPGQKMTKRMRRNRRKTALKRAGEEPNKNDDTPHETHVQRSVCPIASTPIDPTIPMDQIIPIDPATTIYPEQKMPQKKRKKKRKSVLKSEGEEPNKHDGKPHETQLQSSMCPIAATPTDPTIPIDPTTQIYPEQKMQQKKRKKKRKSALKSEGEEEPNKHDGKPRETQLQSSMCPIAATPLDPTIPIDPATQIYPEQNMPQKKRKKKRKSALKSEGEEEPNKHGGKPHETQLQSSMCPIAATPIDPTIPIDPATQIYPAQKMPQKQRKKKRKSALKSDGEEPNEHNAKPTVETPLLGFKGPTVSKVPFDLPSETSMRCNAKPPAKTRFQSTEGFKVTKVPFKWRGESSMICRACKQRGHRFEVCPRLKCLSEDEEICFFCGEIGHSLGKCSVSKAGGGRLAKCLFCYARGHFSNNCPRNGHGIDPKDVAAVGPIIKTVETEEKPVAEITTM